MSVKGELFCDTELAGELLISSAIASLLVSQATESSLILPTMPPELGALGRVHTPGPESVTG